MSSASINFEEPSDVAIRLHCLALAVTYELSKAQITAQSGLQGMVPPLAIYSRAEEFSRYIKEGFLEVGSTSGP